MMWFRKLNYKKLFLVATGIVLFFTLALVYLAWKEKPESIQYGMSFNTLYARELGLDWQEVYDAFLHELEVRHLRLAAHWPMVEPKNGEYNFTELDYQIDEAEKVGAEIILGVGRRLPRWPECHIPSWAQNLTWEQQKQELRKYIKAVVERYKDRDHIKYWQVENEPYLEVFAYSHCGDLDEQFLQEEVALVKELDNSDRPVLVTDSGNLGTWFGAYKSGDAFGTSVYLHFWSPELGQFTTILPAWAYRVKDKTVRLLYGPQETMLIELAAEPWLLEPVTDVPVDVQLSRMNLPMIKDTLEYARATRYDKQYFWGGEWWYWLHRQGKSEIWNWSKEIFQTSK